MSVPSHPTDVCIVGGGPAGMLLGILLAEQKIKTLVLEQHRDFSREYRGEVLMPRFTQMLRQIRLFDFIETYPHLKLRNAEIFFKDHKIADFDFSKTAPGAPFAIWMPQTILLNALHDKAKDNPYFDLWFDTSAQELIKESERITGIVANQAGKRVEIQAKITVGADGRSSVIHRAGNFENDEEDYEFDIIWFTIPKPKNYDNTVRGFLSLKQGYLILPKYPDLIQCGLIARKGQFAAYRKSGIESFRRDILSAHSVMRPFAEGLKDFSPFNVLQARTSHVKEWAKDGCLLIGDAAHTCSPAGAVGVSVAAGTAIVAADVIGKAIRANDFSKKMLGKVQELRDSEVREIQKTQKNITRFLSPDAIVKRTFGFLFLLLLSRTSLLSKLQRRIAVSENPLPIDPGLHF